LMFLRVNEQISLGCASILLIELIPAPRFLCWPFIIAPGMVGSRAPGLFLRRRRFIRKGFVGKQASRFQCGKGKWRWGRRLFGLYALQALDDLLLLVEKFNLPPALLPAVVTK